MGANDSGYALRKTTFAVLVILLLGGCAAAAVPPALTAVSYAADGASLVVTGKSVSDHAISELADQDCALWRVVRLKRPCREYVEPDTQIADATAMGVAGASAGEGEQALAQVQPAARAAVIESELAPPEGQVPAMSAPGDMSVVVLGSFASRDNAARFAAAHAGLGAHVVPAHGETATLYRVISAARPRPAAEALRQELTAAGVAGTWLMPLAPRQPGGSLAALDG